MDTLLQDLRYGLRSLLRSPALALTAVASLGLGIGVNTALFSLMNGAFWSPPPGVQEPEGLFWLSHVRPGPDRIPTGMEYADYVEYQARTDLFRELAIVSGEPRVSVSVEGQPQMANAELVSGNYFSILRMRPAVGRSFLPEEDRTPGTHPVAMISYDLWQSRFGSDPDLRGRELVVNGTPLSVVGVVPRGFRGFDVARPADVWLPTAMFQVAFPLNSGNYLTARYGGWGPAVLGRLAPGVTPAQASTAAEVIAQQLAFAFPETHTGIDAGIFPFKGTLLPGQERGLVSLSIVAAMVTMVVLLIACGNVANLLLARAAGRAREIAIRSAMGASRWRIVRQLLVESLLLAVAGGAAGVVLAMWFLDLFLAFAPTRFLVPVALDGTVLLVTFGISLLTGLVFGLAPALRASRAVITPALKSDAGNGRGRARPQRSLVAGQLALTFMLLVSAGLLVRSLQEAIARDSAFAAKDEVLALSIEPGVLGYDEEQSAILQRGIVEQAAAIPGVESASLAVHAPFRTRTFIGALHVDDRQGLDAEGQHHHLAFEIAPAFFRTLGIPVLRGREFNLEDRSGAPGVVIVNETAARLHWPGEDPLGKRFRLRPEATTWHTVVGVTRDAAYEADHEKVFPAVYRPEMQASPGGGVEVTLLVRTRGDVAAILRPLRERIHALEPDLPVYNVATVAQVIHERHAVRRIGSTILTLFGGLALGLAVIGLYGVMAFAVVQRTREVGIRVALGATGGDVLRLFGRDAMQVGAVGLGVGLPLAVGAAMVLGSMIEGLRPTDTITFGAVAALLLGVTLLAGYLPARRAMRVDPVIALRSE